MAANGLSKTWAVTRTPKEMVSRGGGLAVTKLGRLFDKYVALHPGKRIKWEGT